MSFLNICGKVKMYPQVLFENRLPDRPATLETYRESGGYQALSEALRNGSPESVRGQVRDAGLMGRGGAGFPVFKKWSTIAADAPADRFLLINADEMEPGTFKDREMIHSDPHMLIEGAVLAAFANGCRKGFVFVRPAYETAVQILKREIEIARRAGFLGENILDSDFSFQLEVHRSGGRYICGEGTAIINATMGKRPNPFSPPPFPTSSGLWGLPTLVHNVETLACLPHIVADSGKWFNSLAANEHCAGTKLYCVSGRVERPGCYELPQGIALREIIEESGGGIIGRQTFKACLPGGASTHYMTPEHYDVNMDPVSLSKVGYRLGTAAVIVFDQTSCMVDATLNLTTFFARESCGWCTPCREGLRYIQDLLWRIENGVGEEAFIPRLTQFAGYMKNAYCAFALGAAGPIESLVRHFEEELRDHIRARKCPLKA
jgi:NADH-quinone oxidoreductase subunit F